MTVSVETHPLLQQLGGETIVSFLEELFGNIERACIPIDTFQIDHICWRCDRVEEYIRVGKAFLSNEGFESDLLVEGMIGGRPIATFKLMDPIVVIHNGNPKEIECVEIPAPKAGSPYASGWEHIELVIGTSASKPDDDTEVFAFRDSYPKLAWATAAKDCNTDVSLSFPAKKYLQKTVVKFHACPLSTVIAYEKERGLVEAVPANQPSIAPWAPR